MSRAERKYCLISTLLAWLFGISHITSYLTELCAFVDFLPMRTLCNAYYK